MRTRIPASPRGLLLLGVNLILALALPHASLSQTQPANQKPAAPLQPRVAQTSASTPIPKKPPVGPAVPQSTHYPILLLALGNEPAWSVRIGLKGPERLDRPNYPPIPLEPADVAREGTSDVWTYHAKDAETGASVSVHLSREACSDPPSTAKLTFRASVEHTQLGTMVGCARVATELFPKINNQPTEDEDEDAKDKPAPPTVTNFKVPSAFAFFNSAGKTVFKRGTTVRVIPGKPDPDLSLSHDGKKLLFTTDDAALSLRSINEYDFDANSVTVLLRGNVRNPVWSPDDTHIAFLKQGDNNWQLWVASAADAASSVNLAPVSLDSIQGWLDAHTILASDKEQLYWISDDGRLTQALSIKELCGPDFTPGRDFSIRLHPLNPDLLLVSAFFVHPPAGLPASTREGDVTAFFEYELLSKRRVLLPISDLALAHPEWSRDGLQIYFTANAKHPAKSGIYRVFWDGTSPTFFLTGSGLAIGQ